YISGPVAMFSAEEDCALGTQVTFTDNSIEAEELIWDFGDGSPLVYDDPNPVHVYADEGVYTVTLTAINDQVGCPDISTMNIDLVTDPIALNVVPNEGCPGLNAFITTPDQTSYQSWNIDFGNGITLESNWNENANRWQVYTYYPDTTVYNEFSFNANFIPFITYTSQGYFDIEIETVDWSGCANSTTYEDAVYIYNDFFLADFNINIIEECDSVHLEFEPTGDFLNTWEWQLTDGTVLNDFQFEHVFTAPYDTTFGATFIAMDDFGCSNAVTHTVDIVPPPIPNFSVLSDPSCIGESIDLLNESVGEDLVFFWDFGDPGSGANNTTQETSPDYAYMNNGAYTVCLTAQNTTGCSQTLCQEDLVNIISPIASATYNSAINNCLYGVSFENTTPGTISSSVWDFGDQQIGNGLNVFHTYPIGVFDVELVVINDFGCSDSLVLEDILNLGDVVGPYEVTLDNITCAPFQTSFEAYNSADNSFTYFWEFDDGSGDANNVTSTQHTYNEPGEYCPSLIMEDVNGCTVFVPCEVPFTVEEFTIDVTQPADVCIGEEQFVTASGATSYGWSDPTGLTTTNDGEWTALIDQTTTYGLTGYYEDCQNTVDVTFTVNQLPEAQLPLQAEVCFEENEIPLDMGLPLDGVDGIGIYYVESVIETTFDPSMPFNESYEVVYAFTDNNGCYNADTTEIFIQPLPQVSFPQIPSVCESDEEVALDMATPVGGDYSINGNNLLAFDPSTGMGQYELEYLFTDNNGCSNTDQSTIVVNPLPIPDFSTEDVCFGNGISLNSESSIPEGSIANHTWLMGDGDELVGDEVQNHIYDAPGIYTVLLTATSQEGCVDSISYDLSVLTSPEVDFEMNNGCLEDLFDSNNQTEIVGGTVESWMWSINGEPVSNLDNLSNYSFGEHGPFTVQLLATSNEGCIDSLTQVIEVFPMPIVDFNVEDLCVDEVLNFDNLSTIDSGQMASFEWNAGDGSAISTEFGFSHSYNSPGTYGVSLTVESDENCASSLTQDLTVFAAPVIQFGQDATADCGLAQVNFEDFSFAENSQIQSWQWL
ncbi:MAG: PKD domain-containing protein, partial [Bacteroidota bacterium]